MKKVVIFLLAAPTILVLLFLLLLAVARQQGLLSKADLDFLVEFVKGQKNFDNYIELCFLLEDLFGKKIDLLTPESLSPRLKDQTLSEVRYEVIH